VVDSSYHTKNVKLIKTIENSRDSYNFLFENSANLKVLNYLQECYALNITPIKSQYVLTQYIDEDTIKEIKEYKLSQNQFESFSKAFQYNLEKEIGHGYQVILGLNILSIKDSKGLYVLAYKELFLDVRAKTLVPSNEIKVNKEFIDGVEKYSLARCLPEEEYYLVDNFEKNRKKIIHIIEKYYKNPTDITDSPFLIEISRNGIVDLVSQYQGIIDLYNSSDFSIPLNAFFGDVKSNFIRKKNYPITLLNDKINIDQLLAIHKGMKYPITYVQGPPGTGKTNTIINLIATAFFNEKTVLVTSYNNHPMNGIYKTMRSLKYDKYDIFFPIARLGNADRVKDTLNEIKLAFEKVKNLPIYDNTLNKNRGITTNSLQELSKVLAKYEEKIDLVERKKIIEEIVENPGLMNFSIEIQAKQLTSINKRLEELGFISDEEALSKINTDYESFMKYLNYESIRHLQKLKEPKYKELLDIIYLENEDEKLDLFNKFLSKEENLKIFLKVFPIVITTNLSSFRLGPPKQLFDLCIMDEASQCDQATALIPIIRGRNLVLVGDPQQLNPVILLDKKTNEHLMKKYGIGKEYNYIENSIYKTFLSSDYISDEILLKSHYRCNRKIIEFNNRKYYNGKLIIKSQLDDSNGLVFVNNDGDNLTGRNTSEAEAHDIVKYIKDNPNENIGIITPFNSQKELIKEILIGTNLDSIPCGTIHTFQGDEKDVILFSSAITNQTYKKTYEWLKNNKELINVATSRAAKKLVLFGNQKEIERLNINDSNNDFYELYNYIKKNGNSIITKKETSSRALGVKPYSSELEQDFMDNLVHALEITTTNHIMRREVPIKHVFKENFGIIDLYYTGVFDIVIYRKVNNKEIPVFAIELDGPEHKNNPYKKTNDKKKDYICRQHNFKLIRVENVLARKYYYIKEILNKQFKSS
ncbi:MAG: DNA helicase, partial [Tenericutes bacterium HGW-Tenericutes-5]